MLKAVTPEVRLKVTLFFILSKFSTNNRQNFHNWGGGSKYHFGNFCKNKAYKRVLKVESWRRRPAEQALASTPCPLRMWYQLTYKAFLPPFVKISSSRAKCWWRCGFVVSGTLQLEWKLLQPLCKNLCLHLLKLNICIFKLNKQTCSSADITRMSIAAPCTIAKPWKHPLLFTSWEMNK